MREQDQAEFFSAVSGATEVYRQPITPTALKLWWAVLRDYSLEQVCNALSEHVRTSKYAPVPADVVQLLATSDGRPGAEEAWAIAIQAEDERATVVWTTETRDAFFSAKQLLEAGDEVAARMAFRECYVRLISAARAERREVAWEASLGHDLQRRTEAIEQASRAGLIAREAFAHLLPAPSDLGPIAGLIGGPTDAPVADDATRKRLESLKEMLSGLSHPGDSFASKTISRQRREAELKRLQAEKVAEYEAQHPGVMIETR